MPSASGVHLVGSVPFSSTEEVLLECMKALPGRLTTIPDGETGVRDHFTIWQSQVFPPQILGGLNEKGPLYSQNECEYEDLGSTKYDEAAINSYQVFQRLRNQGRIANGLRFQVSIPTPVNTGWTHLDFENRAQIEPLYTKRLIHDMRNLQNSIPAKDLAIQYNCAVEFAYLEYERGRMPDDTLLEQNT